MFLRGAYRDYLRVRVDVLQVDKHAHHPEAPEGDGLFPFGVSSGRWKGEATMERMHLGLLASLLILSGCATPRTITIERTVEVPVTVVVTPPPVEFPCPVCPTEITCPDCPACPPTAVHGPFGTPLPATGVPAYAPKGSGSYRVDVYIAAGIAPGIWRSTGTVPEGLSGCALAVKSPGGDLELLSIEPPGSTVRIPTGDHQVVIQGCTWVFIKE